MTDIEIKRAVLPRDLKILERLDRLSFPHLQAQIYKEDWKKYQNFIIFVRRKSVGYVSVQPHIGLYNKKGVQERRRGSLHATVLGVIPSYRGKGIGELLTTFVIVYARIGGFQSVNATSRQSNQPIISLVKKMGFRITKKIKKYYDDGETAVVEEFFLKKS